MFVQLFLGLLVLLLVLYILNILDENKMWKMVDMCRRSNVFLNPRSFVQKQIEVINYSPCVMAIHNLLTPLELEQLNCLASGLLQAAQVAVLTAPNHRLVKVMQKRTSVLSEQDITQVSPLQVVEDGNDFDDDATTLCTLLVFMTDQGTVDMPNQGLSISAVPGLALWWYHVKPDGQEEPIQLHYSQPGRLLRIEVYMKPLWD